MEEFLFELIQFGSDLSELLERNRELLELLFVSLGTALLIRIGRGFVILFVDFAKFGFGVRGPHHFEHVQCLIGLVLGDKPARAARDAVQHDEEQNRGDGRNAELPTPLLVAKVE
jgi:hypothetical protein